MSLDSFVTYVLDLYIGAALGMFMPFLSGLESDSVCFKDTAFFQHYRDGARIMGAPVPACPASPQGTVQLTEIGYTNACCLYDL